MIRWWKNRKKDAHLRDPEYWREHHEAAMRAWNNEIKLRVDLEAMIGQLIEGIGRWASDEDGVPEDFADVVNRACESIGRKKLVRDDPYTQEEIEAINAKAAEWSRVFGINDTPPEQASEDIACRDCEAGDIPVARIGQTGLWHRDVMWEQWDRCEKTPEEG